MWRKFETRNYFFLLGSFLWFCAASLATGAEPKETILEIRGDGSAERVPLLGHLEVLEDPTSQLTLDGVCAAPAADEFRPATTGFLNPHSVYWFRLRVVSHDAQPTLYGLIIEADRCEVYSSPAEGGKTLGVTGRTVTVAERASPGSGANVPVLLLPEKPRLLYLRCTHLWGYRYGPEDFFILRLVPALEYRAAAWHLRGLFYGILVAIVGLNGVLYLLIGQRLHLLSALFTATVGLALYCTDGFGERFLWPGAPILSKSRPLLADLCLLAGTLFIHRFVDAPRLMPRLARWSWINLALLVPNGVLLRWWVTWRGVTPVASADAIVLTGQEITALGLAVSCLVIAGRRGQRSAWLFLGGMAPLCLNSAVDTIAAQLTLSLPVIATILSSYYVSMLILLGFVTAGVAYDTRRLGRERKEALRRKLEAQHETVETQRRLLAAFTRFVPGDFLRCLGKSDITEVRLGDAIEAHMTVLFSDLRAFTALSEKLTPAESLAFLNHYLGQIGPLIRQRRGFVDKYIGDAVMALFPESPADAVAAAVAMVRTAREFRHSFDSGLLPETGIGMGVGIHSGALMLGTIGEIERMDPTVISDAVNTAARLETLTKTLRTAILCSAESAQHLAADNEEESRAMGIFKVKGKAQGLAVVEIFASDPDIVRERKRRTKPAFESAVRAFSRADYAGAGLAFRAVLECNPDDGPAAWFVEECARRPVAQTTREFEENFEMFS